MGYEDYVDGIRGDDYMIAQGRVTNMDNLENLTLGYSPFGYFGGQLDNLLIYNVALTPTEIISQYNKGKGYDGYPDGDAPYVNSTAESDDPLEKGFIETINISLCDNSGIDSVRLIIADYNFSMDLISNNTYELYQFSSYYPFSLFQGLINYRIYFTDIRGNIGMYQDSITIINSVSDVLMIVIMIFTTVLSIYLYFKLKGWLFLLFMVLISFSLGIASTQGNIPMTPMFQVFYIVFHVLLFVAKIFDVGK